MLFQEDLSGDKVPDCHQKCDDEFRNAVIDEPDTDEQPHQHVIQDETDDGEDDEDDEFTAARHIVTALEDVAHGGDVVEDDRDGEGDGVADKIRNAEEFRERDHESVVDEKGDDTHDAELHELRDELLQTIPLERRHNKNEPDRFV